MIVMPIFSSPGGWNQGELSQGGLSTLFSPLLPPFVCVPFLQYSVPYSNDNNNNCDYNYNNYDNDDNNNDDYDDDTL